MRFCSICGRKMPNSNKSICPDCRRKQRYPEDTSPLDAPIGLTRRAFSETYSRGARTCVTAAYFGYFAAAVIAVVALTGFLGATKFSLIYAAVVLVLALLIQFVKSRVAAILYLALGAFNLVLNLLVHGNIAGYLNIIGGILAVSGTYQYAQEWREYTSQYETDPARIRRNERW